MCESARVVGAQNDGGQSDTEEDPLNDTECNGDLSAFIDTDLIDKSDTNCYSVAHAQHTNETKWSNNTCDRINNSADLDSPESSGHCNTDSVSIIVIGAIAVMCHMLIMTTHVHYKCNIHSVLHTIQLTYN